MIKINLLPQKRGKVKRAPGVRGPALPGSPDNAGKQLGIGLGALAAAALLVFFVVHLPLSNDLSDYKKKNQQLTAAIAEKSQQLVGYDKLQQQEQDAIKRIQSINRLVESKVVPANILHELGHILSTRGPTMTERMRNLTKSDTNKQFQEDWDPSHVWITSFIDEKGTFKLEGGAQSRDDITQLSKRLSASVYFPTVELTSGEPVSDRELGLSYYKFLITGKVAY